jgi:hypothetical protein
MLKLYRVLAQSGEMTMPTLSYTHETMPKSSEEFQRQMAEAMAAANPIDDLMELAVELRGFEQQYRMTSEEFYRKFNAGEIGDDIDFFDWNATHRMYLRLRKSIEAALVRAAVAYTEPTFVQKDRELERLAV